MKIPKADSLSSLAFVVPFLVANSAFASSTAYLSVDRRVEAANARGVEDGLAELARLGCHLSIKPGYDVTGNCSKTNSADIAENRFGAIVEVSRLIDRIQSVNPKNTKFASVLPALAQMRAQNAKPFYKRSMVEVEREKRLVLTETKTALGIEVEIPAMMKWVDVDLSDRSLRDYEFAEGYYREIVGRAASAVEEVRMLSSYPDAKDLLVRKGIRSIVVYTFDRFETPRQQRDAAYARDGVLSISEFTMSGSRYPQYAIWKPREKGYLLQTLRDLPDVAK